LEYELLQNAKYTISGDQKRSSISISIIAQDDDIVLSKMDHHLLKKQCLFCFINIVMENKIPKVLGDLEHVS
jgi:hypothetical protein